MGMTADDDIDLRNLPGKGFVFGAFGVSGGSRMREADNQINLFRVLRVSQRALAVATGSAKVTGAVNGASVLASFPRRRKDRCADRSASKTIYGRTG
jgi:hypothetical protein